MQRRNFLNLLGGIAAVGALPALVKPNTSNEAIKCGRRLGKFITPIGRQPYKTEEFVHLMCDGYKWHIIK